MAVDRKSSGLWLKSGIFFTHIYNSFATELGNLWAVKQIVDRSSTLQNRSSSCYPVKQQ